MNESALKERLKVVAKEKGVLFNIVWKQLLLERFLARLSRSKHHDHFIFKGGMCLAKRIEIGRETTDIDFLMTRLKSEKPVIEAAFREIIAEGVDDGFAFAWESLEELTQPHMEYPGFRANFAVTLGKMKDKIQVDIGVGDKVAPVEEAFHPFEYKGKPIFAGEITLLSYPVETILAEKLETVVSKGATNSRMKDYHDVWLMLREPGLIAPATAKASIDATFRYRSTVLAVPIRFEADELERLDTLWAQHLTRIAKFRDQLGMPEKIADVLAEINAWLAANDIEGVKS